MYSLSVALVGMVVVFVGLILLIICIKGISAFSKEKAKPVTPAAAPVKVATEEPVVQAVVEQGVPAEVVAAITAAIAQVWESPNAFVVRRVKRINNAPTWNRAGREEQNYSRF